MTAAYLALVPSARTGSLPGDAVATVPADGPLGGVHEVDVPGGAIYTTRELTDQEAADLKARFLAAREPADAANPPHLITVLPAEVEYGDILAGLTRPIDGILTDGITWWYRAGGGTYARKGRVHVWRGTAGRAT